MAPIDDDSTSEANDEKPKYKIKEATQAPESSESPESTDPADTNKSAKSLGNGRWKYHGKTYKEESIGRS